MRRVVTDSRKIRSVRSRSVSTISVKRGSSMMTRSPRLAVSVANGMPSREPVAVLANAIAPERDSARCGQSARYRALDIRSCMRRPSRSPANPRRPGSAHDRDGAPLGRLCKVI
ncbi:hypothetical protein ABID82_003236 [Methylobacterium sp. PvP062]|uniref:Uncharacterized protein n=1 Tax=Methylobacterium radiotolerans TaxID=31998 RepID=A0ABV2NC24_9HYPH|nr:MULTISPECIES: hypothetical protein [unclassified Methylobacterium]MBP2492728.1 hypothetical protein [Methylobacterium sp. PvP105]MBP2500900.1 hypothetical protein [Methylobacterium sp. PvP109]